MKDELGIKVCCKNCENALDSCYGDKEEVCQSQDYCFFIATTEALEKRIKELQEQQFTKAELNTIIDALQIAKEEFAFCPEEKAFDEILKKIEQSLKNSEANLKNAIKAWNRRATTCKKNLQVSRSDFETLEKAYHNALDAYHDVAEKLEELKARSRK